MMSEKIFLLGPDQQHMKGSSEHLLSEPRLIEGRPGTGPLRLNNCPLSSKGKAIYLCYYQQMVQQMTLLLNNAGVDMTNIQIVNAKEEKKYRYLIENQDKVIRLAEEENINFCSFDKAEDYSGEDQLAPILTWDVDKSSVLGVF